MFFTILNLGKDLSSSFEHMPIAWIRTSSDGGRKFLEVLKSKTYDEIKGIHDNFSDFLSSNGPINLLFFTH